MASGFAFEIDGSPKAVQQIVPPSRSERFEGIDFSTSGNVLAIATSDTNDVLLFRRGPDGRFEDAPYRRIGESDGPLDYPHDVSFAACGDTELLAVAQRTGAIAIYRYAQTEGDVSGPVCLISGPESKLAFSDGVTFVPPDNRYLAVCNLELGTISFFRRTSRTPVGFEDTPTFELKHSSIYHPDGLAFSRCGRWLAIANHGKHSVCVFQRRSAILSGGKLRYGPEPVSIIEDPELRFPHSVAFTPRSNHLVVTNAGANYFGVYQPMRHNFRTRWSQSPVSRVIVHDDEAFREVNTANKMEGGPKGVAIRGDRLAICSPQIGVKIYSFRERA